MFLIASALACSLLLQAQSDEESMNPAFEAAAIKHDAPAIDALFKSRPYEVIFLIDGYLEGWLAAQEKGKPDVKNEEEKGAPENPDDLLAFAILGADRADAVFGVDAYSRYAKAWKGWSDEQRKQFREGQSEFHAGSEAKRAHDNDKAKEHFEKSLGLAAPLGDLWGEAQAHQALGDLCFGKDDFKGCEEHHAKALAIFGSLKHPSELRSLRALGQAHEKMGKADVARKDLEKMLEIGKEAKRPESMMAPVLADLARLCRALKDEKAAADYDARAKAAQAEADRLKEEAEKAKGDKKQG